MDLDKSFISGSIPLLVMKLLEDGDLYGYQMIEELRRRSDDTFHLKAGTLYPLLHGLEEKGFVTAYEQAAANVLFQFVEITTGKVGTSDAALEKYVTGEHAMICGTVVNKATR